VLGFEIEPETRKAIEELASQITVVSQERIKTELEQIFMSGSGVSGIKDLHNLGLLLPILPEAEEMSETQMATESLLEHALEVLDMLQKPSFETALAALLHCSGGADEKAYVNESARKTSVAARRLKCSNTERSGAAWLVLNQYALEDPSERKISYLKRLFAHDSFEKLLLLFEAKSKAGCARKNDFTYVNKYYSKLDKDEISPKPLITGTDLIEMGLKPSELFSVIIDSVYDAQLDGEISTRQEAIDMALKTVRES
jgi:poly(A) polymerase